MLRYALWVKAVTGLVKSRSSESQSMYAVVLDWVTSINY